MSTSLVCAQTVARPQPQAHPVTLLSPTLTALQAVSKPFQAHSPLATPRGPIPPSLHPLTCIFSARNPSLPKIPTQAQTRVSRLRSDFISLQISSQPGCWAGPGFSSGTQGPSLLPDASSLRCPVAATWSWWGDREVSQLGRAGATGCGVEPRLPPVPAIPGWGGGSHRLRCRGTSSEALRGGGGLRVQPRGGRAPG